MYLYESNAKCDRERIAYDAQANMFGWRTQSGKSNESMLAFREDPTIDHYDYLSRRLSSSNHHRNFRARKSRS
eukprot:scaffold2072_cov162-Amphora_coffeaeformis.AAC.15